MPAVDSPALDVFASVAAQFCSLVDSHRSLGRDQFLRSMHLLLPELYLSGLQLPPTAVLFKEDEEPAAAGAPTEEPQPGPDRLSQDEAASLMRSLGDLIGDRNLYRTVFDPYEFNSEPEVIGMLADDFAGIYRDLQEGLLKWKRGESGEALWDWRFGLEYHWGRHLVGALHALHVLTASHRLNWPDRTDSVK